MRSPYNNRYRVPGTVSLTKYVRKIDELEELQHISSTGWKKDDPLTPLYFYTDVPVEKGFSLLLDNYTAEEMKLQSRNINYSTQLRTITKRTIKYRVGQEILRIEVKSTEMAKYIARGQTLADELGIGL